MKPITNFRLLSILFLFSLLSSCVSKKEYIKLVHSVESLKEDLTTDTDGEGVIDIRDQEINSPANCSVDTRGITLDSDGDGIADCKDIEPHSPPGYRVKSNGVADLPGPPAKGYASELDNLSIPIFNIPAPHYTKIEDYPIRQMFESISTFGKVDEEFRVILEEAGYIDGSNQQHWSYYQVKQDGKFKGYAIVTAFEKIDETGQALSDRFNLEVNKKAKKSFFDYIFPTSLNKGFFRCFAFLIMEEKQTFYTEGKQLPMDEMTKILKGNSKDLYYKIAAQSISKESKLYVLVYEFEQLESEKYAAPIKEGLGNLSPEVHLKGSNIWQQFKKIN